MSGRSAQILILFALLLPVLATGAVLAGDTGYWMIQKRQMQYAADTAAMVAAQGINENTASSQQSIKDAAKAWLANNANLSGCVDDTAAPTTAQRCAANHPVLNGIYAGGARQFRYVEVIISVPAESLFYNMFRGMGFGTFMGEPTIHARAVAGGVQPVIYAIATTGTQSVNSCSNNPMCLAGSGGNTTIGGSVCSDGAVSAAGGNTSVLGTVVGGGTVDPSINAYATTAGDSNPACEVPSCTFAGYPGYNVANNYTYTINNLSGATPSSYTAGSPAEIMSANTRAPYTVTLAPGDIFRTNNNSPANTNYIGSLSIANNANAATSVTLKPGGWNNITIQGGTVTLQPGVYFIDGDLTMSGGTLVATNTPATADGSTGVTLVVKGDVTITGGTIGTSIASPLTARGATYVTCNTLIYLLPPAASDSNKVEFNGAVTYLAGTIFAPGDPADLTTDSIVEIQGSGGAGFNLRGQILTEQFYLHGTGAASMTFDLDNSMLIPQPYLAE